MLLCRWWAVLSLLLTCVNAVKMRTELHVNPIRRVVSLLQIMENKVKEEAAKEKELFDRYMCYCRSSDETLGKTITDAETKVPQLQSDLNAGTAEKNQLLGDITQATSSRDEAQKTLAEAKSIRTRQAAAFSKQAAEDKSNSVAMEKALVSLKKGAGDSFLQTFNAGILRKYAAGVDIPDWDRRALTSFLSTAQGDEDSQEEPDSSDIIGIISQLHETLNKDMKEAAADENKDIADYDSLVASKTKEIGALSKELESKQARVGEVSVQLVNLARDLDSTSKELEKDKAFLANLQTGCKTKDKEWNERSQDRGNELVAIAETIQMLNDDDAKHLFKKTMPSASLMQVQMTTKQLMRDARKALMASGASKTDPRIGLISMAMHGKKASFGKVEIMIDKMIDLLGKEMKDDENKKQYCEDELDKAEDEKKTLEQTISDSQKSIANSKELAATLSEDILKLATQLKALDKAVEEATKQRKSEHRAYVEELSSNVAAAKILEMAKNRLNAFYNPKLHQPAPKRQLNEAEAISVTMGAAAPTAAPKAASALQEAFSFVQTASSKAAPPPAPDTWEGERKGKGNGVITLLSSLIGNIQKQNAEMKQEEKDAQFEYEQFMAECESKHASGVKSLSAQESEKAETEAELQKHGRELKVANKETVANAEYLQALHKECDWMLKNFKVRRDAREAEIAALRQAKSVLSGADYAFLQLGTHTVHQKRNLRAVHKH